MGLSTQGLIECSFCGVDDGHCICSFPKKKPHGKHLIEIEVDSMIETIHGGSLLMRGESAEKN